MAGEPSEPKRPGGVPTKLGASASDPHRDVIGALHDVSNALTVVLGWVAEARTPMAKAEAVAYALRIIEQRARIARDLARRAIGATPAVADKAEPLEAAVADVLDALAVEIGRSGARLGRTTDSSAIGVSVLAAGDLSQILTNMVLNALAHAPKDSEVAVRIASEGDIIRIDVQDGGTGVEPSRRESIFAGDTDRDGGAGVGLRHARALARAAHGDLELVDTSSAPGAGAGALFRLTWPRAGALPPPPITAPRMRVLQGHHILVVEDDTDVTLLLESALGARGATLTIAHDTTELAAVLRGDDAGSLDAALIDLSPIAADIAGAIGTLRASCPGIHLIVMTGSAEALPDAISTETVRMVRKPFEVSEVVEALVEGRRRKEAEGHA